MAEATKAPPKVTWYAIPAGMKPTKCSGKARGGICDASCYWITTPNGKPLLVNADVPDGKRPSEASGDDGQLDMLTGGPAEVFDGRGQSHFLDCVDRDLFQRGGAR